MVLRAVANNGSSGGSPGGTSGQLQYNNAGSFGGLAGSSWNPATSTLHLTNVLEYAQSDIASNGTILRYKSVPSEGVNFNFSANTAHWTNNGQDYYDDVMVMGWNVLANTEREVGNLPSFGLRWENKFYQGSVFAHEFHLEACDVGGTIHRPFGAFMDRSGGTGSIVSIAAGKINFFDYNSTGGSQIQIDTATKQIHLESGYQLCFASGNQTLAFSPAISYTWSAPQLFNSLATFGAHLRLGADQQIQDSNGNYVLVVRSSDGLVQYRSTAHMAGYVAANCNFSFNVGGTGVMYVGKGSLPSVQIGGASGLGGGTLVVGDTTAITGDSTLLLRAGAAREARLEFGSNSGTYDVGLQRDAAGGILNVMDGGTTATNYRDLNLRSLYSNGTKVLGAQITGYGTPTNGSHQASFDATTITLPNLAAAVAQLITDLKTHGMIGA